MVLDWHIARNERGHFTSGPAILVLDILRGHNRVSAYVAKTLAKAGIHGFVLHMPQDGWRCTAGKPHDWRAFLPSLRQAAADARRCRDVIAALPLVKGPIGIQGTSLGGFVATLSSAIDDAFDVTLLTLAGGNTFDVLSHGKMDAARVRRRLHEAGYDDDSLRRWLWNIEPLRVAHRLDPSRTWLYSARFDQVVSRANSDKLAAAIGLDREHHRRIFGCHYTSVLFAPRFLADFVRIIRQRTPGGYTSAAS